MHLATSWRLVVPVKHADRAKTRLLLEEDTDRSALARAIATDTLASVLNAIPATHLAVVSSDPQVGPWAHRLGAAVIPDPGRGLNAAISAGLAHWQLPVPCGADSAPRLVGVLLGDLPALRADDLLTALEAATAHPAAVVPDLDGTGTVLLTSTRGASAVRPAFGPGSARAHAIDGAVRLELNLPRLRTDADTAHALQLIRGLGAGPRTSALLDYS